MKHELAPKDVVRILHDGWYSFPKTGVVNRIDETTGFVNVFPKGHYIGIWFLPKDLKRIGRIK